MRLTIEHNYNENGRCFFCSYKPTTYKMFFADIGSKGGRAMFYPLCKMCYEDIEKTIVDKKVQKLKITRDVIGKGKSTEYRRTRTQAFNECIDILNQ